METLKRINLDKVKEMFEIAGIEPARNNPNKCLLAAYETVNQKMDLDQQYQDGIVDGWDNYSVDRSKDYKDPLKYKLGRSDGAEAARIMNL